MTAPLHQYRYTYAITDQHGLLVRGNTKARNVAEVRSLLAVVHGAAAADAARVEISRVEESEHE